MNYLAGPFFNPAQVAVIKQIETLVETVMGWTLYSPRRDGGVLLDMTPEVRAANARRLFVENVDRITQSDHVIAVIDDRDPGTVWELGYAYCLRRGREMLGNGTKPRIISFTNHDYGLNIMIQECVDAHCRGIGQLQACLKSGRWEDFRMFDRAKST